jgi:predicted double-glycine peptidase
MHPAPLLHSSSRPRIRGLRRHPTPGPARRLARRLAAAALLGSVILALTGAAAVARDPMAPLRYVTRAQLRMEGARLLGWEGVVPQRTLWDCGPAAVATLMLQLGHEVPTLERVARLAGTTPRGTAMRGLSDALDALGVRHAVQLSGVTRLDARPVLAWVRPGHFVVVERSAERGMVDVLDPRVGRYRIAASAFARSWPGAALVPERP